MSVELLLYPQLCTCSKRAIKRTRTKFGMPYHYRPRGTLLKRLAAHNGLTIEETYDQLMRERKELTRFNP